MKMLASSLTIAALVALTVAGCSGNGEKSPEPDGNKGAGHGDGNGSAASAKETLVGTWKLDMQLDEEKLKESMRQKAKAQGRPAPKDEQMKAALEMTKGIADSMSMSITMNADGTTTTKKTMKNPFDPTKKPKEETEKGTWEVVKEDGGTVMLKVATTEGENKGKTKEITIKLDGDSAFVVTDTSDKMMKDFPGVMKFTRQ